MDVEVRLFGGLRERVGAGRITVELDEAATVADLRKAVADAHPSIAAVLPRTSVAVDLEVAPDDAKLSGTHELALLPPVAGGGDADDDVRTLTGLVSPPFDIDAAVAQVADPAAGGTVVFLGTVRDHAADLDDVVALEYSAYDEMAERVLADLADEVARDHPAVTGVALLHAVGELPVGAHTVLIVCAAPHRDQAFDASRDALERVKDRVPVWKREIVADGSHRWVGMAPDSTTAESAEGAT